MRLLILSDLHGRDTRLQAILAEAGRRDGIVFVGDLTRRWNDGTAGRLLETLEAGGGRILALPGNMDDPALATLMERRGISLHGSGIVMEGTGFFGVGGSNPTPFHTPFEIAEDDIARLLARGYESVKNAERKVLVSHVPPAGCRLDRTGLGVHAGSPAVRRFIKEHDIGLCLCGHIHEAAGEEDVDGVRCVNVGAAHNGRYALLDIQEAAMTVTMKQLRA
jgi:Icc-related predicted phosphoesterase